MNHLSQSHHFTELEVVACMAKLHTYLKFSGKIKTLKLCEILQIYSNLVLTLNSSAGTLESSISRKLLMRLARLCPVYMPPSITSINGSIGCGGSSLSLQNLLKKEIKTDSVQRSSNKCKN